MKALILAAGRGKRISEITNEVPKALIEYGGQTLLEWQISAMNKNDIHDIGIVTGYKSHCFDNIPCFKVTNNNWESTNMVYSLFCALDYFKDLDGLIVSYSDIIYEKNVVANLLNSQGDIVVTVDNHWLDLWKLRSDNPLEMAESLKINQEGNIIDIGRNAASIEEIEAQFIGLIKFNKKGIKSIINFYNDVKENSELLNGKSIETCYMTDYLYAMINNGYQIKPSFINGGWLEFDTYSDFKIYNQLLQKNKIDNFFKIK